MSRRKRNHSQRVREQKRRARRAAQSTAAQSTAAREEGARDEGLEQKLAELLARPSIHTKDKVSSYASSPLLSSSSSLPPSPSSPPSGKARSLKHEDKRLIAILIGEGIGLRRCAELIGCAAGAIFAELRRDAIFGEMVRLGRIQAEQTLIAQIRKGAEQSWRAAAWLLARADKDRQEDADLEAEFNAALREIPQLTAEQEAEIAKIQEEASSSKDKGPMTDDLEQFLTTPPDSDQSPQWEFDSEEAESPRQFESDEPVAPDHSPVGV